jgi:hypothetical protein
MVMGRNLEKRKTDEAIQKYEKGIPVVNILQFTVSS